MKERFLHYVWEFQNFEKTHLSTTDQTSVRVIFPGRLNAHSGPDFEEAVVDIEGVRWYGKIEMHIKSSDWYLHNHHLDLAYDQVVLHVCWEDDKPVFRQNNTKIPCLELKKRISNELLEKNSFFEKKDVLPCACFLKEISPIYKTAMLQRVLVERLQRKASEIHALVQDGMPVEDVIYYLLFKNFGFKYNEHGFVLLAKLLPMQLLRKQQDNAFQIRALLLGHTGFLDESPTDEEMQSLCQEYLFLAHKYQIEGDKIQPGVFKIGGLRPSNHPKRRLNQLAFLLAKRINLFDLAIKPATKKEYHQALEINRKNVEFRLGSTTIDKILINTVIPFKYYMATKDDAMSIDDAVNVLTEIQKERNAKIDQLVNLEFENKSAADSQSLIELWDCYCSQKNCLDCQIGTKIMNGAG